MANSSRQCTEDSGKAGHLPPLKTAELVQHCSIENCRWVGDISKLEEHNKAEHQTLILQPIERQSSTHLVIPKKYVDEVQSLEHKIEELQRTMKELGDKLIQLKKELSDCEQHYYKIKKTKEEHEIGTNKKICNEQHAAQFDRSYQLEWMERDCSDAFQKVRAKRKEVEKMEGKIKRTKWNIHTDREQLQTLRSNHSKVEEPVRFIERTHVPSNQQSAASSVASVGLANSQRSLNQEQSTDSLTVQNAVRTEQAPHGNTHAAVNDVRSNFPSLITSRADHPSLHPIPFSNIRRNVTLPSLQSNVAATRQSMDSATLQSRPPRSARPSTGQARSAAPRNHRRRRSLTDCPNCAQLRTELQRSKQTISSLRLKQQCKLD